MDRSRRRIPRAGAITGVLIGFAVAIPIPIQRHRGPPGRVIGILAVPVNALVRYPALRRTHVAMAVMQ
jgi:hypothetical protein